MVGRDFLKAEIADFTHNSADVPTNSNVVFDQDWLFDSHSNDEEFGGFTSSDIDECSVPEFLELFHSGTESEDYYRFLDIEN